MSDIINFDLLFNEQLRAINNPKIKESMLSCRCLLDTNLREFRTIIINSPRQCGRTTWMINKAIEMHGRIIVKENNYRNTFIKNNPKIQPTSVLTLYEFLNADPIITNDYDKITPVTFVVDHVITLDRLSLLFYSHLSKHVDENHLVVLC